MTILLAAAFALLSLATFLLARLWTENASLVQSRRKTAQLLRRVRQQRDHHADELVTLSEEHESLMETCCELQVELDEYRREDARRDALRARGRAWLN